MKRILTFLIIHVVLFGNTATCFGKDQQIKNCSSKDREYAKFWDNYYDPEDAYNFGRKIKRLVKEKTLKDYLLLSKAN